MAADGFLVGFGGTGARVLEASLYLGASGYARKSMHMVMIDPDKANGNVMHLKQQADAYRQIQAEVAKAPMLDADSLFSLPLNPDAESQSFAWEYPLSTAPFSDLLHTQGDAKARKLFELLYDADDMEMQFDQGYVGRAHIGSLDMFRVLEAAAKRAKDPQRISTDNDGLLTLVDKLRERAAAGGANLVVVGSVFGGTGASGLPAIPVLLEKILPESLRSKVTISGVFLAPYFGFPEGANGAPESSLHPLATKAALYHYASTSAGYDRIYLVGAPSRHNTNDQNRIGGMEQCNKAHYAELAAALAIEHCIAEPPVSAKTTGTEILVATEGEVAWPNLPSEDTSFLRQRCALLSTFCAFHAWFHSNDMSNGLHHNAKWHRDLTAQAGRRLGGREPELLAVEKFASRFMTWLAEVATLPEASLFTPGDPTNHRSIGSMLAGGSRPEDGFHEIVSGLDRVGRLDANTGTGWYVRAATRSVSRYCASNFSAWWGVSPGGAHV